VNVEWTQMVCGLQSGGSVLVLYRREHQSRNTSDWEDASVALLDNTPLGEPPSDPRSARRETERRPSFLRYLFLFSLWILRCPSYIVMLAGFSLPYNTRAGVRFHSISPATNWAGRRSQLVMYGRKKSRAVGNTEGDVETQCDRQIS